MREQQINYSIITLCHDQIITLSYIIFFFERWYGARKLYNFFSHMHDQWTVYIYILSYSFKERKGIELLTVSIFTQAMNHIQ
jgi:hypothetical protein